MSLGLGSTLNMSGSELASMKLLEVLRLGDSRMSDMAASIDLASPVKRP